MSNHSCYSRLQESVCIIRVLIYCIATPVLWFVLEDCNLLAVCYHTLAAIYTYLARATEQRRVESLQSRLYFFTF